MSTSSAEKAEQAPTYGGWRRPASPGAFHLKLIPTLAGGAAVLVTVVISMSFTFVFGLIFAGVALVLAAPAIVQVKGRPLYSMRARSRAFRRGVRRGQHVYLSGIAGVNRAGLRNLPGLLAKVAVWRAFDGIGREFALVEILAAQQWAVVMQVTAQGGALVDPETRNIQVARWAEFLAMLGEDGGIVQATVTGETIPVSSAAMTAHVSRLIDPDAPEFARRVMIAEGEEFPAGVTETICYVAVTYDEKAFGIDRKNLKGRAVAEAVAEQIGRGLPEVSMRLVDVGASKGIPLTAGQLGRRVHEAFDPVMSVEYAQLDAAGDPVEIDWDDAGPAWHEEEPGGVEYHHDSGISCTWEALKVPPGIVTDQALQRLMSPIAGAPRKRVTLLYRPVDAGKTADTVDRDYKAALNRSGQHKLEKAHESLDLQSAKQATAEEARGAGVVSFSLLVTATVSKGDRVAFDRATRAVVQAGKSSRFRLSPVRGAQAAAFAGALGIGLSLADLSIIPAAVRDHI